MHRFFAIFISKKNSYDTMKSPLYQYIAHISIAFKWYINYFASSYLSNATNH
jgi:hypothetical protein